MAVADRAGIETTAARDGAMMVAAIDKDGTTTAVTTVGTIVVVAATSQLHPPTLQPTTVAPARDMAPQASLTTPATPGHPDHSLGRMDKVLSLGKEAKEPRQEVVLSGHKHETQELTTHTIEVNESVHNQLCFIMFYFPTINVFG